MARFFHQTYTTFDKRTGKRVIRKTKKWYARLPGEKTATPLLTDLGLSKIYYADLIHEREKSKVSSYDPLAKHRQTTLTQHLSDWLAWMQSGTVTGKQIAQVYHRASSVIAESQWVVSTDASPSGLEAALSRLGRGCGRGSGDQVRDWSPQTRNSYLKAVKQFYRWLLDDGRISFSPIAGVKARSTRQDRRHDRRALTMEELQRLFQAARESTWVYRGIDGTARYHLYLLASATGFRLHELSTIEGESFDWQAGTVTVMGAYTKNKLTARQPLPPDVLEAMRAWVQPGPLWPGTWQERGARMLRHDLREAGIPYRDAAERVADFHALRHTFITLLVASGAAPKVAQQLARHSDIRLTLDRYTHLEDEELKRAAGNMPRLTL